MGLGRTRVRMGSISIEQAPRALVNRYRCKRSPLLSVQRERAAQVHHDTVTQACLVAHAVVVVVRSTVLLVVQAGTARELRHAGLRARAALKVSVTANRRKRGTSCEVVLRKRVNAGGSAVRTVAVAFTGVE